MPDNPLIVALLKVYAEEETVTKTEAGALVGKNRNQIAGITGRNAKKIGSWPKLNPERKKNRHCQFPIGTPGTDGFHLCDKLREGGDDLRCKEHKGKIWNPSE